MSGLPFSVSPEAAAYIAESLRHGDADPGCAKLVPALCQWLNSRTRDADGHLIERFDGESWGIGYHDPDEIAGDAFVAIEIGGRSLHIYRDSLDDLTGKRLVMETVGVGVPSPAGKKVRMLRAV
jgi:hypothetical protein